MQPKIKLLSCCRSRENGNPLASADFMDSGSPLRYARNDMHLKLLAGKNLIIEQGPPRFTLRTCCDTIASENQAIQMAIEPLLNEFIRVWGQIEVKKQRRSEIEERTLSKFSVVERRFHEYKGHLSEVYMIQILWNGQGKTLPGKYLHSAEDIEMPHRFFYIDQRHRKSSGKNMEVDIYGGAATEVWMAESKWRTGRKVGPDAVKHLLRQDEIVKEREKEHIERLRLWIFAHGGFTREAEKLMEEHRVLWSAREDLDGLLATVGLRKLPDLE